MYAVMENQRYLETAILGADRMELIRILYRGAIAAIQEARQNLSRGEIMQRSKSISRALDCISELTLSLNHETPGGISQQLADLYQYVQQLLLKAHARKSDAKLVEAASILETMLSAWTEIKPASASGVGAYATTSDCGNAASVAEATTREDPANPYAPCGGGDSRGRTWDF
jgi:flagellar secretion chaperone FliS